MRKSLALAVLLLAGCSAISELRLAGTWGGWIAGTGSYYVEFDFYAGGNLTLRDIETAEAYWGTWEISGEILSLSVEGESLGEWAMDWQSDGSILLTLVGSWPSSMHLNRM
jgi:hypothetical protein